VGPRAGLNGLEKRIFFTLPGLELQPLSRPARSQSLYRLRYPGSFIQRVPGVKRPGREADRSSPIGAEVKKTWMYISTSPYVFMA
jgi:hypothetical protein